MIYTDMIKEVMVVFFVADQNATGLAFTK